MTAQYRGGRCATLIFAVFDAPLGSTVFDAPDTTLKFAPRDSRPVDDPVNSTQADDRRHLGDADAIVDSADEDVAATMERLRTVSYYLDEAFEIPGTNYRVGLDPFLGLVPGVGDATGSALSAYILVEAALLGVPRETLARMFGNVLLDATVGSLPLVGDVFDAAWKANSRNVRLLESRYDTPEAREADRRFLLGAVLVVTLLLVALGVATTLGVLWALGRLGLL
ncbi:hypothetical protein C453_17339 [Haloferax elongans ATCC BAA-1513]|uniref:DUF4112 domain-containing protein n=1 Tax=Haloferax elongans ATCC BAA-1513 TaxID=1230453 RepID=M0HDI7_HALEO|nr:hypothetical protein C453_17339 [Haloferax elongans ATCC BAA-1513]